MFLLVLFSFFFCFPFWFGSVCLLLAMTFYLKTLCYCFAKPSQAIFLTSRLLSIHPLDSVLYIPTLFPCTYFLAADPKSDWIGRTRTIGSARRKKTAPFLDWIGLDLIGLGWREGSGPLYCTCHIN